jgi:DNA primase
LISLTTIEQVRDLDVVQVVQKFGPELKKIGVNHWGCCPFHNEKTPSFAVSFARQTFKCFGCGEAGDGIGFVMKNRNLGFEEAVKEIASSFGIAVEYDTSEQAQKRTAQIKKKRSLAELTSQTLKFLKHNQPKVVTKFTGTIEDTIELFDVVLTSDSWSALADYLKKENIDLKQAQKLGIVAHVQNGPNKGGYIDSLRNCLVFPLHSERGNILGFSGRRLNPKEVKKFGKYVNPATNDLYNKSEFLYGLYQAREAMEQTGECNLVEGYTDVISMHFAGFQNTVASCGTALTPKQAALIRNHAKHVNILRDGDAAGQKAAERDFEILLKAGLTCSIVEIPEGHDPDSLIMQNWN